MPLFDKITAIATAIGSLFSSAPAEPVPIPDFDTQIHSTTSEGFIASDPVYDASQNVIHDGEAQQLYPAKFGEIEYMDLDTQGRVAGAYGIISKQNREVAKAWKQTGEGNPLDTGKDPAFWPNNNTEVTVTWPDGKTYNGWFWNRSHLIADSLGGKSDTNSWITGTRAQNVGKNAQDGGMAYTEEKTRNFLDAQPDGSTCGVYYSAVPTYLSGQDTIPFSVTVDMKSCDGKLNERVIVTNTMPGYAINYSTGEYAKVKAD